VNGESIDLSGYLTIANAASTYQPTLNAGNGLSKTGNTISLNSSQNFGSLQVVGQNVATQNWVHIGLSTKQNNISVSAPLVLTGTQLSIDLSGYLTTASAASIYQPIISAGNGISLSGNTISLN